jgi:predicted hydrocarbon binding protein
MAEIKGKFINLAYNFLRTRPAAQQAATSAVQRLTGTPAGELDPEQFYDTKVLDEVFQAVLNSEQGIRAKAALKTIGQEVYYEIKWTAGLPDNLQDPVDYVKFEAEGFLANHRGTGVIPRKFVKSEPGHCVVEAPSPGYNCIWIEGVYEGILRMCGKLKTANVTQTQCVMNGDPTCVYDIKW